MTDAIDRACARNFVKADSPLELTVRRHASEFFSADGSMLDEKLDSYIAEQRQKNEFFKDSFTATPPTVAAGLDTLHLSEKERAAIDSGELVIPGSGEPTASVAGVIVARSDQEFDQIRAKGKVG